MADTGTSEADKGAPRRPGFIESLEIAVQTEGFEAAEFLVAKHEAYLWSKLSQIAEPRDPTLSHKYAERAFERAPRSVQAPYARRLMRLEHELTGRLPSDRVLQAMFESSDPEDAYRAARLIEDVRVWDELAVGGFPLPARRETPAYSPIPAKVVYCLHNSLPYDNGGYATRSHGILQSVNRVGFSLVAYTRLAYPLDTPRRIRQTPNLDFPEEDVIDGVVYRRMPTATEGRRQMPVDEYMRLYAEALERVVRRERPEMLHAASAFLVGIPAVAVARRLGIPCVYEVRGLWELTHLSRDPNWVENRQHDAYVRLETQATMTADAVITLTNPLKQELIRRGVPEAKITVVPNSVDTDRFVPLERDAALARRLGMERTRVVGYVGSFIDYEGLDDLLHAAAVALDRGTDFRLLLVGDGPEAARLRALIEDLELTDHVIMPGRVPFEDVQRYYSLIDIAVFPRKPWPVTEMVSPMKPFEAMAMEKALLVSSVEALTEFVADGKTGVVFEKGDIDSLADALERLVEDPDLCRRLGQNARAWVVANRRWDRAAAAIREVYRKVRVPIPPPELDLQDRADTDLAKGMRNPGERERQAAILSYPWNGRVLDVGIGHGHVACQIALAHRPDLIVGVDLSRGRVKGARTLARINDAGKFEVVVARGERLPLASKSFDRVHLSQVLEHVEHPDKIIREVGRVLKPEGSALIAVPRYGKMPPGTIPGHVQDFTIADMRRLIDDAGLETVEHRTVGVREFYFARPVVWRDTAGCRATTRAVRGSRHATPETDRP